MKLFTAFTIAALSALISAQEVIFDEASGTFTCPTASGIYCAGDSLASDIIIRCTNFVGQPARCSNNLVGQPPLGANPARCYASDTADGIAACEKNCIVYGSSGNTGPNFSLPDCVPYDDTEGPASDSSTTVGPTSTSFSVSNPTLGTTISSASMSNPTLGTTISSESVSKPTLGTTIAEPSYGPGPGPETTLSPSGYYNTTVTFTSRSTILTCATPCASNPNPTVTEPSYGPGPETTPCASNPNPTVIEPSYGPGPETTLCASNPIPTVIEPSYGSGPGPETTIFPPGYYNTTVTFTSRSTILTCATPCASNPNPTVTEPSYGPGPETTPCASNPIPTVIEPSYGSGPGPETTISPPGYYNTTVTFTSRSTTLTYAPPIYATTVTRDESASTYIPLPIPTTVTFADTTYIYGPQPSVPTTDSPLTLTLTKSSTTITYNNPTLSTFICSRTAGDFGCGHGGVGSSYSAGPTGGGGGSGGGGSGNGTYAVPTPSQTIAPSNTPSYAPVGPPATTPGVPPYTGAAASNIAEFGLVILGLAAALAL